jgi:hypothetical protein
MVVSYIKVEDVAGSLTMRVTERADLLARDEQMDGKYALVTNTSRAPRSPMPMALTARPWSSRSCRQSPRRANYSPVSPLP